MSATTSSSSAARTAWGEGAAPRGFRGRVLLSVLGPIAWLIFTLLYVGFWAKGFSLFQDVVVVLVSILVLGGVMAAVWISWGGRWMRDWK